MINAIRTTVPVIAAGDDGEHGRQQREHHARVGHEAEEAAEDTGEKRVGNVNDGERRPAHRREQDADHEVADDKGAGHFRHAFEAAGYGYAIGSVKEPEEAVIDVIPPAQHEINEERHERGHEHELVERS